MLTKTINFLRRLLYLLASLFLVILLGVAGAASVVGLESWNERREIEKGESLFRASCAGCHDLLRIAEPRRVQDWKTIVTRMAGKPGSSMDEEARDAITAYIQAANGYFTGYRRGLLYLSQYRRSAEKHWRERCSTCHLLSVAQHNPEEPGVLYSAIERDRRMDVLNLPIAARDLIFDFLHLESMRSPVDLLRYPCTRCHSIRFTAAYAVGARLPREEARLNTDAELFSRRCYVCHTPDIRKRCRSREEWMSIVDRMRGKAQTRLTEGESSRIIDHLSSRDDCIEGWDNSVLPVPLLKKSRLKSKRAMNPDQRKIR